MSRAGGGELASHVPSGRGGNDWVDNCLIGWVVILSRWACLSTRMSWLSCPERQHHLTRKKPSQTHVHVDVPRARTSAQTWETRETAQFPPAHSDAMCCLPQKLRERQTSSRVGRSLSSSLTSRRISNGPLLFIRISNQRVRVMLLWRACVICLDFDSYSLDAVWSNCGTRKHLSEHQPKLQQRDPRELSNHVVIYIPSTFAS